MLDAPESEKSYLKGVGKILFTAQQNNLFICFCFDLCTMWAVCPAVQLFDMSNTAILSYTKIGVINISRGSVNQVKLNGVFLLHGVGVKVAVLISFP